MCKHDLQQTKSWALHWNNMTHFFVEHAAAYVAHKIQNLAEDLGLCTAHALSSYLLRWGDVAVIYSFFFEQNHFSLKTWQDQFHYVNYTSPFQILIQDTTFNRL